MTRKELLENVSGVSGESKATVERVIHALCGVMETEFKDGGEIMLHGIGKLVVKNTPARMGRNLRTGEPIEIPAARKVKFVAAKNLTDILKG